ncbi:hypothetical protein Tco_0673654 [Tanacetum coccineum]
MDELLVERDGLMWQLKQNLLTAKHHMEVKSNHKGREVKFSVEIKANRKRHEVEFIGSQTSYGGTETEAMSELLDEFQERQPMEQLVAVCDSRLLLQNGNLVQHFGTMGGTISGGSNVGMVDGFPISISYL